MTPIDFTHLPYWDLCAALRPVAQIVQWGLDDTTECSFVWFPKADPFIAQRSLRAQYRGH